MSRYHRYVAIIDDATQQLTDYEYNTMGCSEEDARLNAQIVFPYGSIRDVYLADYSADSDAYRARVARRRKWAQRRDRAGLRKNLPDNILEPLLQAKSLE